VGLPGYVYPPEASEGPNTCTLVNSSVNDRLPERHKRNLVAYRDPTGPATWLLASVVPGNQVPNTVARNRAKLSTTRALVAFSQYKEPPFQQPHLELRRSFTNVQHVDRLAFKSAGLITE
jgi:hypothetical protein